MANYTDDQLWNMSDDELEAAFKEASAQEQSPETAIEEDFEDIEVEEETDSTEDLEQPIDDEDSDDDTSSDDDDEEEDSEEDSETDESEPDEEQDSEDEQTTEEDDKSEDEEQPVLRKYRANGKEYEFSDDEIFEKFGQVFGQAMNYTQKMQQIKPWRKTIDAIEQANLSQDDVNLAIDVLKGDKDAIASLLKRTGVDALELDVDNSEYQPKDYGRNETELAIKDIVDEIKGDKEYDTTYDILESKWDSKSRSEFIDNPELIRQLHIDVKSGMFDTIAPMANKLKVYDGGKKSDLDYYKEAAGQYFEKLGQEEARLEKTEQAEIAKEKISKVKADTEKRKATKSASVKRKAAAPTKKVSGVKKRTDYLDASDEEFDDWYNKLMDAH
ncbi:MAG: hypothetical protein PVF17_00355 [Ignavibacteria bacterium]|jgi:hypothetical protein